MPHGIDDDYGGVGGGQGIDDASVGSETTTEVAGLKDGPEESMTTMEALAEKDEHKDFNNDNIGIGGG